MTILKIYLEQTNYCIEIIAEDILFSYSVNIQYGLRF
jgi:hypothetical protein